MVVLSVDDCEAGAVAAAALVVGVQLGEAGGDAATLVVDGVVGGEHQGAAPGPVQFLVHHVAQLDQVSAPAKVSGGHSLETLSN